jgi:glucokinase
VAEPEEARHYLCLDFGGTKVAAGIVDAPTGSVVEHTRRRMPGDEGAEESQRAALAACEEVLATSALTLDALRGIGISFGGPVAGHGRAVIRSMHVRSWEGVELPDALARGFGLTAVMENDANAAALAESRCGAGRGVRELLYVQASTGIGAGLVVNGALYRGGGGGAGELGHVVVDPNGPLCACGKRGCLESIAAGWAIGRDGREALARSEGGSRLRSLAAARDGVVDAELVIAAARAGDGAAKEIVARAFTALGIAIAGAVNLLDPELIVLGGGIARADDSSCRR